MPSINAKCFRYSSTYTVLCFEEFSSWNLKLGNVYTQVWLSSLHVQKCLQGWALCKQLEYGYCSPENHEFKAYFKAIFVTILESKINGFNTLHI